MPTNGFSIKPLKVKLFAGEQKATECPFCAPQAPASSWTSRCSWRSLGGSAWAAVFCAAVAAGGCCLLGSRRGSPSWTSSAGTWRSAREPKRSGCPRTARRSSWWGLGKDTSFGTPTRLVLGRKANRSNSPGKQEATPLACPHRDSLFSQAGFPDLVKYGHSLAFWAHFVKSSSEGTHSRLNLWTILSD